MGASKRLDISKKYQIGLSDHQLQRFLENMSLLLLFLFLYSRLRCYSKRGISVPHVGRHSVDNPIVIEIT